MTREEIIRNLKYTMEKHKNDTVDTFGTNISVMCKDILDYLEQEPCDDCCNGNQIEKAKLCQKSYIAGMEHKQEPLTDALDKIRAEIDEARFIDKDTKICENALASGLEVAMKIIDKYKNEMLK